MLLHAFRCVTCQQQLDLYIYSNHIRYRDESVVARSQVRPVPAGRLYTLQHLENGSGAVYLEQTCTIKHSAYLLYLEEG
jgi:hypothetical protein